MPRTSSRARNVDFEVVDHAEVPEGRSGGRGDLSPASLALLGGQTIFMEGKNRASRFSNMAKPRGYRVRTRAGNRKGRDGTYVWLEPLAEAAGLPQDARVAAGDQADGVDGASEQQPPK